jgi:predicted homoserine dehydrogenase-like protein
MSEKIEQKIADLADELYLDTDEEVNLLREAILDIVEITKSESGIVRPHRKGRIITYEQQLEAKRLKMLNQRQDEQKAFNPEEEAKDLGL